MPYKNLEDRRANRRLKSIVARNNRYRAQGLEPLEPNDPRSPVKCIDCGKVTTSTTAGVYRHYDDCPRYEKTYWSRRGRTDGLYRTAYTSTD